VPQGLSGVGWTYDKTLLMALLVGLDGVARFVGGGPLGAALYARRGRSCHGA
jgi:hypothetical protein